MEFKIDNNNKNSIFNISLSDSEDGIFIYDVLFRPEQACSPSKITVEFNIPYIDAFSLWNSECGLVRNVLPDWRPQHQISKSRLASGVPIQSVISQSGNNVFTLSVNDAKTPIEISCGTEEADKSCLCKIAFFTGSIGEINEYKSQIIIDRRKIPFYKAISDAAERMRGSEQFVPSHARMPMYSTWYNFHQNINDGELLEECKRAYELGMRTIIIDDGWQTENNGGGYAYCGDWRVCKSKIEDMHAFVAAVHDIGMKVMLWYSVPYVGKHSDAWVRFRGRFLNGEEKEWSCLDPRFPEVREYLISIYEKAVREWNLDGFKLDFIDAFALTEYSDKTSGERDFESLEDAIECLLKEITSRLKSINPDMLLEFRQPYVGPVVTKYGNMIRVGDCALDAFINRVGVLDLRLTSGRAAVHSDMITWNDNDTNESVAKQLIAVLFGVPQISVRLSEITPEHYEVLKFWLSFWTENKEVLLDGELRIYNPEANYSMAEAVLNNKKICVCYSRNIVGTSENELVTVNGTGEGYIAVRAAGDFEYEILDCMGRRIECAPIKMNGISVFNVPQSGVLHMYKRK